MSDAYKCRLHIGSRTSRQMFSRLWSEKHAVLNCQVLWCRWCVTRCTQLLLRMYIQIIFTFVAMLLYFLWRITLAMQQDPNMSLHVFRRERGPCQREVMTIRLTFMHPTLTMCDFWFLFLIHIFLVLLLFSNLSIINFILAFIRLCRNRSTPSRYLSDIPARVYMLSCNWYLQKIMGLESQLEEAVKKRQFLLADRIQNKITKTQSRVAISKRATCAPFFERLPFYHSWLLGDVVHAVDWPSFVLSSWCSVNEITFCTGSS